MKRSHKIAVAVSAALGLGLAAAAFAHPDGKDMPMQHGMMGHGMAKEMGAARTPEQRQKMAASHRAEMQKHSHEKKGSNE